MSNVQDRVAGGVSAALARRQSVRAFLATPVSRETVADILAQAARAPSNGNLQPWRVAVASGERLRAIEGRALAMVDDGHVTDGLPVTVYPPRLWEPYRSRRHDAGVERYAAMGYFDKDPAGLRHLTTMNCGFFGAPVGLVFCLQQGMQRHQWCDLGMFMQSVMLLAAERGLDTCPQAYWTNWGGILHEELALDPNLEVVAGMGLGHRDPDHPINQYRTARAPVDSFATFHGF